MRRYLVTAWLLCLMHVTVFAQVDLTIREVQISTTSLAAGEPLTASLMYANNGSENITQSTSVSCFISSTNSISNATWLGTNFNVPSISANSTVSGTLRFYVPLNLSPGTYYLFYVVDYSNELSETNENNNTSTGIAINVTAYNVDLFVNNLTLTPTTINGQGVLNISFQLGNLGTTVAHMVGVKIIVSDTNLIMQGQQVVTLYSFTQLSIGGASFTTNFNRNVSFNGGNFYVKVEVDHGNMYNEPNETNNVTSFQPLTIINNTSDIHLSALSSFSASSILGRGKSFSFNFDLQNKGTTWILDNFKIGYYLSSDANWDTSDVKIGENIDPLFYFSTFGFTPSAPKFNMFGSITIPGTIPLGEYFLLVYADYENKIQEFDRTNNFLVSSKIRVNEPLPDLYVYSASSILTYESFSQTYRLNLFLDIGNVGNGDADNPEVTFYLQNNNTQERILLGIETVTGRININDRNSIARTYFLSNSLAGGNFSVVVIIDEENKILELSKSNNTYTTSGFVATSVQQKSTNVSSFYNVVAHPDNRYEIVIRPEYAPVTLKIFNTQGILFNQFSNQATNLILPLLPPGIYIVNAVSEGLIQSDKIVIY